MNKDRAERMIAELVNAAQSAPESNDRYIAEAKRLRQLVDADELGSIAHTAITLEDVEQAEAIRRNLRGISHNGFMDLRSQREARMKCLIRDVRWHEKHNHVEEAAQARHLLETEAESYRRDYAADGVWYAMHQDDLYSIVDDATTARDAIMSAYLYQCAVFAIDALVSNISTWTKQPTHYKRMRSAAERIIDAALVGTGCTCYLSTTGDYVKFCYSWGSCRELRQVHYDSVEIRIWRDESGMTDVETFARDAERMRGREQAAITMAEICDRCAELHDAKNELRRLNSEYQDRVRAIRDRLRILPNVDDDLARLARCYF